MEDLKGEVPNDSGRVACSLDLREVSKGFAFLYFSLMSPTIIDDFK